MDYGNIRNVDTTGASQATANQDRIGYSGVPASRKMAETDSAKMPKYRSLIEQAATDLRMDACVIAGIASRETRAGGVIGKNGYGFDGHGYGLMQVDDRYHALQGGPFSLEHIKQATGILISFIGEVQKKHPTWTKDMALKGGLCAYNAGVSRVQTYDSMDAATTGHDYSNDVVARAQYYKDNGY